MIASFSKSKGEWEMITTENDYNAHKVRTFLCRDIWNDFNWLGKITLFLPFLLAIPLIGFIFLFFKVEDFCPEQFT